MISPIQKFSDLIHRLGTCTVYDMQCNGVECNVMLCYDYVMINDYEKVFVCMYYNVYI